MSTTISPELQAKIEQEADDLTAKLNDNNDYQAGVINGTRAGYEAAGEKYALKWEQAEQQLEQMAKALEIVQKWQTPPTGKLWDNKEKTPMSYEACYGSNGVRDFMKNVANQALADYNNYKKGKDGK